MAVLVLVITELWTRNLTKVMIRGDVILAATNVFCISCAVLTQVPIGAVQQASYYSAPAVDKKARLFHPTAQAVLMDSLPFISVFAGHTP
jgi:hypothetical protein